jgi:hypothetical protein
LAAFFLAALHPIIAIGVVAAGAYAAYKTVKIFQRADIDTSNTFIRGVKEANKGLEQNLDYQLSANPEKKWENDLSASRGIDAGRIR